VNIQYVHRSPKKSARALDDARLVKMVLEAAQMLCSSLNLEMGQEVTPYRTSHATNPLIVWAMKSDKNWAWLWHWGNELGNEYMHRFGKRHASHLVIQGLTFQFGHKIKDRPRPKKFHNGARHRGLGIDYSHMKNVRKAYRKYLRNRWELSSRPPKWTKRDKPKWA
jgi:hypothetical protein